MKVCPYCNGVTEEKNAIKCEVCGQDITKEKEYTKEELEDEFVQEGIEISRRVRKNKKQKKKLLVGLLVIVIIFVFSMIISLLQPTGYINIENSRYEMKVGNQIEIKLEYGGKVKAKNVEVEIVSSDYDGTKISFRYSIEDDICYITGYYADNITLKFNVKDNGEQKNYNNEVRIIITE